MPTFTRIQYHRYGGPELLRLEQFEPAAPGEGEALVRVLAAAANPMDWKLRRGDSKLMTGRRFPRGVGHDFAGVVEQVGPGVTGFTPGDAVLGAASLKAAGAFAELVTAPAKQLVKKPAELSYEQAATLPTTGVTAVQALIGKGKLRAGQRVFIHGCLGGVGRTAAQIALLHGATVAGSCRATARADAEALGIGPVVDFDFDFDADTDQLKRRFDIVFDTAGTLPLKAARALLKPGGRILDINVSPSNMAAKLARSTFSRDYNVVVATYAADDLAELARIAAEGKLELAVARTVPLGDALGALTELETKHTPKGGKLVITMQ